LFDALMVFLNGIHRHAPLQGFDPIDQCFCTEERGEQDYINEKNTNLPKPENARE